VDLVRIRENLITGLALNIISVWKRSLERPTNTRGDHEAGIRKTRCKNFYRIRLDHHKMATYFPTV
jgi:hypothetical protein